MITTCLIGYHSCTQDNGYDYIINNIPFLSGSGENQWLTEGYYFWTDSDYWALKWPNEQTPKVVSKFDITISESEEILDLVGNVSHQIHFVDLIETVAKTIESTTNGKPITVNQVINFLRTSAPDDIFPYIGIKAEDNRKSIASIPFIAGKFDNKSKKFKQAPIMSLIKRQQLCIFPEGKVNLKLVDITHPDNYSTQFRNLAQPIK